MRIGIVILPQRPWHEQRELWRRAEDYGFDHAFTYDHLSWRSLAGQSWGATVPTLAGAALVTERIRLGTFVASPNFRHPVPFAKDLATIDEMSGGRFTLGLGAGTTGFDADVLGTAPLTAGDRHARFMEFVDVLDLLLRFEQPGTDGIDFDGQWYTAARARMVGRPAQSPRMPFVIAANGPRGIARAVQTGQGWVTTGPATDDEREWWSGVGALARRVDDAEAAASRTRPLDRYLSLDSGAAYSLASAVRFEDAVARAEDLGFTDVIAHWPRADGIYAGDESVLDQIAPASR
ncbi:LLM class flavin-dependent oxidoreductase [Microbacterium terrisoli]|uniref:LLM class flavin-dependent oxidoreductase n=1 Tax=Microbacterium terrisoli TaxID=3242192 RepID=UPI002805AAB3|nr:LLM class flavin-dependent oxidoreductase [Microbacterium protaetiae]